MRGLDRLSETRSAIGMIKHRQRRQRGSMAPTEVSDLQQEPSPASVLFLDRKSGQCAWPLWGADTPAPERMVCGSPTSIGLNSAGNIRICPYCPRHSRIAYSPRGR